MEHTTRGTLQDVQSSWDEKASIWEQRTGDDGDTNRQVSSDPVLFSLLPPIKNINVLDAGCGTGYLSMKMYQLGLSLLCLNSK